MMLDSPAFACSLVRPLLATPVKVLLATDRHENRKFSVRTPRSANVLRPERSDSERRGRQSPNARRGATWRGLDRREHRAKLIQRGKLLRWTRVKLGGSLAPLLFEPR